MGELPIHAAVVHVPLGIAFVLPFVAIAVTVLIWSKRADRFAWAPVPLLLVVALLGGIVAMRSGEEDEERVERVVPEDAIEEHEEKAEAFVWTTGVTAAVSLLALFLKVERWRRIAMAATTALTFAMAGLAVVTGHAGGNLVYRHGAAQAHGASLDPDVPSRYDDHDDHDD